MPRHRRVMPGGRGPGKSPVPPPAPGRVSRQVSSGCPAPHLLGSARASGDAAASPGAPLRRLAHAGWSPRLNLQGRSGSRLRRSAEAAASVSGCDSPRLAPEAHGRPPQRRRPARLGCRPGGTVPFAEPLPAASTHTAGARRRAGSGLLRRAARRGGEAVPSPRRRGCPRPAPAAPREAQGGPVELPAGRPAAPCGTAGGCRHPTVGLRDRAQAEA